jgi:hypothetical protein
MLKRSLLNPAHPMWLTVVQALVLQLALALILSPVFIHATVPLILRATVRYGAVGLAWTAVLSGLLVDLLTCATPMGYFGLCTWLIAILLRPLHQRLDQERWSSLWTLIALWSVALAFVQWLGALTSGVPVQGSWKPLMLQLVAGPLANCALLSLWFSLPTTLRWKWSRS